MFRFCIQYSTNVKQREICRTSFSSHSRLYNQDKFLIVIAKIMEISQILLISSDLAVPYIKVQHSINQFKVSVFRPFVFSACLLNWPENH